MGVADDSARLRFGAAPHDAVKAGPDGVVGVLLAGGQGTRLGALTAREAKPAVRFAGESRIVDFVMANACASGIDPLIVCTQWHPETLVAHLRGHWGPGFPRGLVMRDGSAVAGGYRGTAHAVACNAAEIDAAGAEVVVVLAGDHIYRMDYREMVAAHRRVGRPVTVAALPVLREEARGFGVLETDGPCHVLRFLEKPAAPPAMWGDPARALASMGIYVFDWPWLRARLGPEGPVDFGNDLLPGAVEAEDVAVFCFGGAGATPYWRDVGTPGALDAARADVLTGRAPFGLPEFPAG